jgi:hypothetical protein
MMIQLRGKTLPTNVEKVVCGTPVGLLYTDKSSDNLQFRLRYLPAEAKGRPRLISIDYRMQIRVGNVEFNHNIPVLDVVIQRSPSKETPLTEGARPPYAALNWVCAGKREKNRARLASLGKLLDAGKRPEEGTLGAVNKEFLAYLLDERCAPRMPDYEMLFRWAEDRKRYLGPLDKQKTPFSGDTFEETCNNVSHNYKECNAISNLFLYGKLVLGHLRQLAPRGVRILSIFIMAPASINSMLLSV